MYPKCCWSVSCDNIRMQHKFIIFLSFFVVQALGAGLKEEFTWTYINYAWPENTTKCQGYEVPKGNKDFMFPTDERPKRGYYRLKNRLGVEEETPEYSLENNIPMGATRYKNKLFITVPRRRVGIPATLSYVSLDCKARHNVPLTPYPSWDLNALNKPRSNNPADLNNPLVSVYRTTVDACDRLWFVDMGILEYPTGRQQLQQFVLVVVDLNTDKIIRRFPFTTTDANELTTLASVTVDVTKETCDNAFAYIPDLVNYKLLVYSWKENRAWRIAHNSFFLDPQGGEFSIGGQNFQWNDGIFSVALTKQQNDGYRTAYFHAMASTKEFAINTRILRNDSLATRSYHADDFSFAGDRGKNGQSSSHEIHQPTNMMLLGMVNRHGMFCWNINKPFTRANLGLVHQDLRKMIYPSDVKLDDMNNVWMMTNSMPIFLYSNLNYNDINFRVWTNNVRDAIAGTVCEK